MLGMMELRMDGVSEGCGMGVRWWGWERPTEKEGLEKLRETSRLAPHLCFR